MLNTRKTTRITAHTASPIPIAENWVPQATTLSGQSVGRNPDQFPRSFQKLTVEEEGAAGHDYLVEGGRKILDVSGGAAVSILGPGPNERIWDAISKAYARYGGYSCAYSFTNGPTRDFIDALLRTTGGHMETAILYLSGQYLFAMSCTF